MTSWTTVSNLLRDASYALRTAAKNPDFAAVVLLSTALSVGASSAIFSVVRAVLIDPFPYRGADRIGFLYVSNRKGNNGVVGYQTAEFIELAERTRTVESVIAFRRQQVVITDGGLPTAIVKDEVSPNAFDFFGVPPLLGHVFSSSGKAAPVGVLSYAFWQRRFGGNPDAIGRHLRFNGGIYTVIGVLPPRFQWQDADVYVPLDLSSNELVQLAIKVKPGTQKGHVEAEFQTFHEKFSKASVLHYPDAPFRTNFVTMRDNVLGKFSQTLLVLLAASGFLIFIGCANVANLLLARAAVRQGEIALRSSLGATRGRIIQQLLTESIVLSLTGGALGIALAFAGIKAVVALMPQYSVPHEAVIGIDWQVLCFAFAASVVSGIIFGLAPAVHLSGQREKQSLKFAGKGSAASRPGQRLRNALIVAEVAISLTLLTGAGLTIRSLIALQQRPLGYEPKRVLVFSIALPADRYTTWIQRQIFFDEVLGRLRRLPRVVSVGASSTGTPPASGLDVKLQVEGQSGSDDSQSRMNLVSAGYLETLDIPLLRGRYLNDADVQRANAVVVVTDDLVQRYFQAGEDPVGRRIRLNRLSESWPPGFLKPAARDESFEIVGVVGKARNAGLNQPPEPSLYVPNSRLYPPWMTMLIRTTTEPLELATSAAQAVRAADPQQPIILVTSLERLLSRETAYPRFATFLFGVFGIIGLVLGTTGVFSVVSYSVARRTSEFGIRMALGATPAQVLLLAVGSTGRAVTLGALLGVLFSIIASKTLVEQIPGLGTADSSVLVVVPMVLTATALAACVFAARSATKIQPIDALRQE